MNLLLEHSDILFRFMNFRGFLDLLENDRLLLTIDNENEKELQDLGRFFASFARSSSSSYFDKIGVIIVVDGKRLGQRYKFVPIDYWKEKMIKYDEMEERLVSKEHVIPGFTDYIIEAYLLIRRKEICNHAAILERILKLAEERGVSLKTHIDVKNLSWIYLRNHDQTDDLVKMLKTCKNRTFLPKPFSFFKYDKNYLEAFLTLVQFAEKGGKMSERALKLFHDNIDVADSEEAARDFVVDSILVLLNEHRSPTSDAYFEAVMVARLFRNKDPIRFVQEVFRKARERILSKTS